PTLTADGLGGLHCDTSLTGGFRSRIQPPLSHDFANRVQGSPLSSSLQPPSVSFKVCLVRYASLPQVSSLQPSPFKIRFQFISPRPAGERVAARPPGEGIPVSGGPRFT